MVSIEFLRLYPLCDIILKILLLNDLFYWTKRADNIMVGNCKILLHLASLLLTTPHDPKPVSFSHALPLPPKRELTQYLQFHHY
jgi:hypothetical protein